MKSPEKFEIFLGLYDKYFISDRLNDFLNHHPVNVVQDYTKHWQAKRYLEIIYTINNWYYNNIEE